MELIRNSSENGTGKYAILNLMKLLKVQTENQPTSFEIAMAMKTLEEAGVLEWGPAGSAEEFFVLKLKDRYAGFALHQYATAVGENDPEYAAAIFTLSERAGNKSPFCKTPD